MYDSQNDLTKFDLKKRTIFWFLLLFLLWKLRTQGRHHHEQSTPVLSLLLNPLGKRTCSNWLVWAESKNAGRITGWRTTKNPAVLLLSVVIKKGEHATSVLLMCSRCESHLLYYRQEGKACSPVCVPTSVCVCVCKGGTVFTMQRSSNILRECVSFR